MKIRNDVWAIPSLAVMAAFTVACTKLSSARAPASIDGASTTAGTSFDTDASPYRDFVVRGDGTISVWQDKQLFFSPSDGRPGPYTIDNLPSWATFDAQSGIIVGIPRKGSDATTFTITRVGGRTYGPYTVQIIGDPLKEQQWHLFNSGQTGFALLPGVAGQDIHQSESIQNNILGASVRIAVSDSGVVIAHPDLRPNNLRDENRNYLNKFSVTQSWLGDPTPDASNPSDAHGTAVAGLAAAKGWNGIGGRGVAPEAKFAAFKYLPAQSALAAAGMFVMGLLDQFSGTFDVYNYSWGDDQCSLLQYQQTFSDKLLAGVTNQRDGKGAVYMMAAGNSFLEDVSHCYSNVPANTAFVLGNSNFSEMNTNPYLMNIASVTADGVSASYSTPGSANWVSGIGGEHGFSVANKVVEANQPALVTTDYPGCANGLSSIHALDSVFDAGKYNPNCEYTNTMNGTSGATPVAAGAVALMLDANPDLTWRDVKYILARTADKVDPNASFVNHPNSSMNLPGHVYELPWVTNAAGFHFHDWYGFGRVNVDRAVAMAQEYDVNLGKFRSTGFRSSGAISAAIPDASAVGVTQTMAISDALTIEAVQVRLSISDCAGDMGLELTSPSETKSYLMNINSGLRDGAITNHIFLSNAFLGEPSAGTWKLRVIDGHATCVANLTNWQLNVHGH